MSLFVLFSKVFCVCYSDLMLFLPNEFALCVCWQFQDPKVYNYEILTFNV